VVHEHAEQLPVLRKGLVDLCRGAELPDGIDEPLDIGPPFLDIEGLRVDGVDQEQFFPPFLQDDEVVRYGQVGAPGCGACSFCVFNDILLFS
jgi:hypothetical protein